MSNGLCFNFIELFLISCDFDFMWNVTMWFFEYEIIIIIIKSVDPHSNCTHKLHWTVSHFVAVIDILLDP